MMNARNPTERNSLLDSNESFEAHMWVTKLRYSNFESYVGDPHQKLLIQEGTSLWRGILKLYPVSSVGADLTLDQAVDISRTYELSQSQLKAMKSLNYEDVHGVGKHNNKYKRKVNYSKSQMQTGKNVLSSNSSKCGKCGLQHQKHEVCKAKGQKCHKCLKYNHFARQCRTGKVATVEIALMHHLKQSLMMSFLLMLCQVTTGPRVFQNKYLLK